MEYSNFIPEGWIENKENYDLATIKEAYAKGKILQGYVDECDSNLNLHIDLGDGISGIIPKNEIDFFSYDEDGCTKPSICKNKENTFVQFKIKEIIDEKNVVLSRKKASEDTLNWFMENLSKRNYC